MAYIGNQLQTAQPNYQIIDDISGSFDGTTTTFALQVGGVTPTPFPVSAQHCIISVGGVVQEPDPTGTNGFLLSGSNIVFSSAPSSGESFFGTVLAGADYINVGASFPDGSVANPSITFDQDLDTGLYRSASGTTSISANGTNVADFGPSQVTFNNGNVGIGTTSPSYPLSIFKDSNAFINISDSATTAFVGVNTGIAGLDLQSTSLTRFYNNGAERARIDSSGRLLVGTSSASTNGLLTVQCDSNQDGIVLRAENTGGVGSQPGIVFEGPTGTELVNLYVDNTASELRINTAGMERMRIDSSGRLLAGTSSLAALGTVNAYSNSAIPGLRAVGGSSMGLGSAAMAVDKHANVSTTSQVFMVFTVNSQATGCGRINANGPSQAAFGTFSDRRLKENIVDMPPQLENICRLRPIEFDYIESEGGGHQTSFIAQEFEEVYPDAIGEREDGMKTLTGWGKTEAILVKAFQEAVEKINALEARLSALEGGAS